MAAIADVRFGTISGESNSTFNVDVVSKVSWITFFKCVKIES